VGILVGLQNSPRKTPAGLPAGVLRFAAAVAPARSSTSLRCRVGDGRSFQWQSLKQSAEDLDSKLVSEQGQGVFIPPPPPTSFGISGNHPSADWVKRRLTPHPVSTFDSPSKSPTQSWIGGASSSAITTGRRSPASTSRRSRDGGRRPGRHVLANLAGGRFNASSTIPVHGAAWVIVETPTRHHPRRRGRPIPRRLLLVWSERVRISSTVAGANLRWLGSHARGDPQKQRRQHARTRAGFSEPASFLCAYVYLEGGARQVRGGQAPHPRRGAAHRRQHRRAAGAVAAGSGLRPIRSLPLILLFTLGNIHIGRLGFQANPCPASLGETNEISSRDIALTQGPRAGEGK
jgi:hypothetical protein